MVSNLLPLNYPTTLLPYYSTTLDRHYYYHDETVAWVADKCLPVKNDFEKGTSLLEAPRRNGPSEITGIGEFTLAHPSVEPQYHKQHHGVR